MTYNETTLPDRFLEPPIAPLHPYQRATWRRNWSIYQIYMNWSGKGKGMLPIIAAWVHQQDHKKTLTRQRIQAIAKEVHWSLRDYHALQLDTIDTAPTKS